MHIILEVVAFGGADKSLGRYPNEAVLERSAEMGLLIMGFASLGSPEQVHGSVSHPLVSEDYWRDP